MTKPIHPYVQLFISLIILIGCHTKQSAQQKKEETSAIFSIGQPQGKVSKKLHEASGLVASIRNPGMLWTVNDSGNPAEVFLIDSTAAIRMTVKLKDVANRDWEDLTIGKGDGGKPYLFIGDIGDNYGKRDEKWIYQFEEPVLNGRDTIINTFDTLVIKLSDGPRDTEAMMIDPLSKDLYLISKRDEKVGVYKISYPFEGDTLIALKTTTLSYRSIVGANISKDGQELLMKSYDEVFYWRRKENESLEDMLKREALKMPYKKEVQGEAICFALNGNGFYTLSESLANRAELMFHPRK